MNRKLLNSFIAGGLSVPLVFASAQCGKLDKYKNEDAKNFNEQVRDKTLSQIKKIFDKDHPESLKQALKLEDEINKWIFGNDKVDFEIKKELLSVFSANDYKLLQDIKGSDPKAPSHEDTKNLKKDQQEALNKKYKKELASFVDKFKLAVLSTEFDIFESKYKEVAQKKQSSHKKYVEKLEKALKTFKESLNSEKVKSEGEKVFAYGDFLKENWPTLLKLVKS
ncbi:hypothetical protein FCM49_01970 [Mycoplasma bovis]|nr:hypothetical protein [Mycoplasmopsis bovis]AEI90223.1 lipoprotein [Mycoplasmopsis bovis Hubei-1]AFM51902.1 putative lipoprotein [Mycoplasmopsis bovis HB0801]AIA34088.1 hypothetical protein K668_02550 [Mycoplasmopsis bovis CQ-W70]AKO50706.1 hypothetical protein AAV31_02685 [Mycoplasmopsis bovis]AQU85803.1 hypothetical protein B0W43_02775 [Mycoplasmopsis bovis]